MSKAPPVVIVQAPADPDAIARLVRALADLLRRRRSR